MSPKAKTWIYIGIIVVLLVIIGLLGWFLYIRSKSAAPTTINTTATSTNPFANATSTASIANTNAPATHITASGRYYSVDMQYPSSTALAQSANTTADAQAVEVMQTFVQNTENTFVQQNNLATMTAAQAQIEGILPGQEYQLSDSYQFYSSPATISYLLTIEEDTLGAHPNEYYQTFTFDAKTGTQLQLSDLFQPGSNYLSELSTISSQMLTTQLGSNADADMINSGTSPTANNFQNFALDGSNLDLFFPPYQVAAYANGAQEVQIPLSQLQSILNPQY